MAITYGQVGSLKKVKYYLAKNKIDAFKSLGEIIKFNQNYSTLRGKISDNLKLALLSEKKFLSIEIPEIEYDLLKIVEHFDKNFAEKFEAKNDYIFLLKNKNKKDYINKIFLFLKLEYLKFQIKILKKTYNLLRKRSTNRTQKKLLKKQKRFSDLQFNFDKIHKNDVKKAIKEIDFKKEIIDIIINDVHGAIGEKKVERELQTLPDNHYIINDFSLVFQKAIYKKSTQEYIKSIQIDHLLVAPSGIFIIETKNWSKHSINNLDFRSPVEQIHRFSFTLFTLLEKNRNNIVSYHRWGNKKIPIKSLIVFTQTKPTQEFQFIKILNHKEIIKYISYFPSIFSDKETKNIATYLNQLQ